MWFVYIIRCADNSLYTGISNDLKRRISEHNISNTIGAKYVKYRRPATLVYSEKAESRSQALRREVRIKKLSRLAKEGLIYAEANNQLVDNKYTLE